MPASPALINEHHEKQAREALDDDAHYIDSIARMAEARDVSAHEAVFTSSGIKLIEKGVKVDGGLRDRLVNHRLLKPIDASLEAEESVDGKRLAQEATRLVDCSPVLQQLLDHDDELQACLRLLNELELPGQLVFKLTLMQSRMPWLLDHALVSALICHSLAAQLKLSEAQIKDAVLAGLTHDLGELHTNPTLLDRRHKMSHDELSHIDVHPITGFLIVGNVLPDHPAVGIAVLQHHERLDGSGYPNRLHGTAIGKLARILSVAEAAASITIRANDSERLSTWMRLSRHKHDVVILGLLHKRLRLDGLDAQTEHALEASEIEATTQLLRRWSELSATLSSNPPTATAFLFERMAGLRTILLQFGFDPSNTNALQLLAAEEDFGRELVLAFDEVRRQIRDIEREILRRRETLSKSTLLTDRELLDSWLTEIHSYHLVATPFDRSPDVERRQKTTS